jgi:hypothetical protein
MIASFASPNNMSGTILGEQQSGNGYPIQGVWSFVGDKNGITIPLDSQNPIKVKKKEIAKKPRPNSKNKLSLQPESLAQFSVSGADITNVKSARHISQPKEEKPRFITTPTNNDNEGKKDLARKFKIMKDYKNLISAAAKTSPKKINPAPAPVPLPQEIESPSKCIHIIIF